MKLQAIRLQNYQERKRIQQRMMLYQAPSYNKQEVKQPAPVASKVEKPRADRPGEDKVEGEKLSPPSSAIPPPTSPPPQLDPEERKRKIAALKVTLSLSSSLSLPLLSIGHSFLHIHLCTCIFRLKLTSRLVH